MTETDEKAAAQHKLTFLQQEYWRVNNGKQRYLRCPYCASEQGKVKVYHRNFFGAPQFCCPTFARALKAILDRQDEVDKAAQAARTIVRIAEMAERAEMN
jgi:hypothetical protein